MKSSMSIVLVVCVILFTAINGAVDCDQHGLGCTTKKTRCISQLTGDDACSHKVGIENSPFETYAACEYKDDRKKCLGRGYQYSCTCVVESVSRIFSTLIIMKRKDCFTSLHAFVLSLKIHFSSY